MFGLSNALVYWAWSTQPWTGLLNVTRIVCLDCSNTASVLCTRDWIVMFSLVLGLKRNRLPLYLRDHCYSSLKAILFWNMIWSVNTVHRARIMHTHAYMCVYALHTVTADDVVLQACTRQQNPILNTLFTKWKTWCLIPRPQLQKQEHRLMHLAILTPSFLLSSYNETQIRQGSGVAEGGQLWVQILQYHRYRSEYQQFVLSWQPPASFP